MCCTFQYGIVAQSHVLYREIYQITIAVISMFKQTQNQRITTGIELSKSSNIRLTMHLIPHGLERASNSLHIEKTIDLEKGCAVLYLRPVATHIIGIVLDFFLMLPVFMKSCNERTAQVTAVLRQVLPDSDYASSKGCCNVTSRDIRDTKNRPVSGFIITVFLLCRVVYQFWPFRDFF
mmetsp:Transcript_33719/g.45582  ORF Transcript_33719/g.45582 Transcript_33719/m.45582 type:complete len:178 (+) Transcript_33719:81-614(+)